MKILSAIAAIVAIPVVALEYFTLLWFWGGDGLFTLVTIPVCFLIYLATFLLLNRKYRQKKPKNVWIILAGILLLPIVTVATVWGLAGILGVSIAIA